MDSADGVAWESDYGAPDRRTVAGQQSEADWIKDCTAKISNAIGGGSELFLRHGDGFRLDVDFVCKRIVEMRERHWEARRSCVLAARQAEALQRALQKVGERASGGTVIPGQSQEMTAERVRFLEQDIRDIVARALLGGENAE